MKTISISNSYNLKWQIKFATHYKVSSDRQIINCKTGRIIKKTISGGYSIGYWISKRFIPINKLNEFCEKIKDESIPF